MSTYTFDINSAWIDHFFVIIRNKKQVIDVLMRSIKFMLLNQKVHKDDCVGNIVIEVDKMSRIFFCRQNKIFSLVFPFVVSYDKTLDSYMFMYQNKIKIDAFISSKILGILNENLLMQTDQYLFLDIIDRLQKEINDDNLWCLLRDLILLEDGYLRYDNDKKNEKGDLHPLNRYDLYYSSSATFKIGLKSPISIDDFKDFLNIKTDCKYIS
jgi:hypothetical protein